MKKNKNIFSFDFIRACVAVVLLLTLNGSNLLALDSQAMAPKKAKPVKNTFGSVWLIDNQTVIVPIKGTFEFDIQHRFGTVKNGISDLAGFFAPSNIR